MIGSHELQGDNYRLKVTLLVQLYAMCIVQEKNRRHPGESATRSPFDLIVPFFQLCRQKFLE